MVIVKQKGYDNFKCIAVECPESCCKYWQIVVDDTSLEKYRKLSATDDRIRNHINERDHTFRQNGRICGFLDPDELCYLQKTYGEKALCETCYLYPRHIEEFENVREYSLSLSCPQAAKQLIEDKSEMSFMTEETDEEEEYEEFDYFLYDKLLDARECLYKIAKDRKLSLAARLDRIIDFGNEFQKLIDNDCLFETEELIKRFLFEMENSDEHDPVFDYENEKRAFSVLFDLEMLHEDWIGTLDRTWKSLFDKSKGNNFPDSFRLFIKENEAAGEQILMLFLYTYFCGSVYDGWALSKILLCVFSVKWIFMIAYASGAEKSALVKAAYQYAREIEHSDQNIDQLEEWFQERF